MRDDKGMTGANGIRILYLVHDLSDATAHKRVRMLLAGGALVTPAGFRRTDEKVEIIAGCRAVDFGRTYNAGFLQRIVVLFREVFLLHRHRALFAGADIILARNLEMLAIAVRGRSLSQPAPDIIYESLDIHRLLLGQGLVSKSLRWLEGWCAKRASALITSSPAFISQYFTPLSHVRLPARLVENKILLSDDASIEYFPRQAGPVWKIGWFGMIRCRKSLTILTELVRRSAGGVEVIIRGRVSKDQFDDFDALVSNVEGIRFSGAYKPEELSGMYAAVHFTWAIDMFEEGLNSSWLLPNRLYEGGFYGSVPIAVDSVETGRFLKLLGIGVTLPEPLLSSLTGFFGQLTPERYHALESAAFNVDKATWAADAQDCRELVEYISHSRAGS